MFILIERFGQTYTFDVPEGFEEPQDPDSTEPPKPEPEICLLEALDGVSNLLRSVFPEMEGHHLAVLCDDLDGEVGDEELKNGDGGIKL